MDRFVEIGLTYDDVLLRPAWSDVLPREVDISTRFSRNVPINIPLASAAMDTVTDARLAIALAQQGGIGVIHRNLTVELQTLEVEKVKRSANGVIFDPITLTPDATAGQARGLMRDHKISGMPVLARDGKVVGILTHRDLRFFDLARPSGERGHDPRPGDCSQGHHHRAGPGHPAPSQGGKADPARLQRPAGRPDHHEGHPPHGGVPPGGARRARPLAGGRRDRSGRLRPRKGPCWTRAWTCWWWTRRTGTRPT